MNFGHFLASRRQQFNFVSAKEHYEKLGGKPSLGIELRQWQLIENGKSAPSPRVFAEVFRLTPASERHIAIKAYFESLFADETTGVEILDFLENYLNPGIETSQRNLWESNRNVLFYNEAQMNYLRMNTDALRLFKKVLLFDEAPESSAGVVPSKIKALQELGLVEVSNGYVRPTRNLFRLPSYENSGPQLVSKANDLILDHLKMYMSREGSPNQELGYGMQLVEHSVGDRVVAQMKAFKRWVQSTASEKTDSSVSPLVFVGFVKKLSKKEL